ncbi:collagen alpha-1(III) chain-like [Camarhynchus parvulus]|uniref:collagen alpha-1(III) chain-like n=1 Tax=Geospiza parvula TaxID=87175 RepID=UPI0012381A49|nr:collagen alpha-1(III) chain-like [Camarhynchus parvulus]
MERRGGHRKRQAGLDPGQLRARAAPPPPREGRARLGDALRGGSGRPAAAGPSGGAAESGAGPEHGSIRAPRGGRGPIRVPAMLSGRGGRGWSGRRGSLAAGAGRPCPSPRARSGPAVARCPRCLPGPSPRGPRRCGIARPRPGRSLAGKWRFPSCGGAGCGVPGPAPGVRGNAERPGGSSGEPRGVRGPRGVPGRISGVTRPPRHACLSSLWRLTAAIAARRVSALGASIS